jgi:uncharacterized membrane protein YhaH (DUF805 family)
MLWHRFLRFDGRIGLAAFWGTIGILAFAHLLMRWMLGDNNQSGVLAVLAVMLLMATPPLVLAAATKRLHDRGKSGWWIVFAAVPIIGWIWAVIDLGLRFGDPGRNRYGLPNDGSPFDRGPSVWTLTRSAYRGAE